MIVEFRLDETRVQPAYLKTLYDLIEEVNCRCNTYLEETYKKDRRKYCKTRVVEVCGSPTMVSWLILRMQRYSHYVNNLDAGRSVLDTCTSEE
jgi:homospermidine synthase